MEDRKNTLKKKNTERINKDIIRDVGQYLGVDQDDISRDDVINEMHPNEIFYKWCEWNGYVSCSEKFKRVVGNIYGIDIERGVIMK